jgi:CBS domain containing-hemolysin-like protein
VNLLSLVAAAALLAGNAFFVGAEFALISARRDRVEPIATDGDRRAKIVLHAVENLSPMLAAAQLGITLCSLALGAVAEPAVAHLLAGVLNAVRVPDAAQHGIALVVALTLVASLHMVLGEMVPKNLALTGPERAALWLGPPLVAFARAVRPLIVFLNTFSNRVLRLIGVEPADELASAYTPEELASMIAESRHEGLLEAAEHELLTSALSLSQSAAGDVMIPIGKVVTVPWTITAAQLERLVTRTGFSRFPVLGSNGAAVPRDPARDAPLPVATRRPGSLRRSAGTSGRSVARPARHGDQVPSPPEIVGFVHAKDVLGLDDAARETPLPARRLRRMVELAADLPLDQVLQLMQRAGSHLARVVAPGSGVTVGVIALEDVVEEFVGEVEDASHRA